MIMAHALTLSLACLAAVLCMAAAQSYGAGPMDCSSIAGCAQCRPVAFNIREAAEKFAAQKAAKVQGRQARVAAKAAKAGTAGSAAAALAPNTPRGRRLVTAEAVEVAEAVVPGETPDMAVAPSCVACESGFSLVTKSVQGRPAMGRCECAAGYGRQEKTFTKLTPRGVTRLVKTFTCSQCGPNQVPLTPAAGLRITNAGVVLVQQPIVAAAGQQVPRGKYLPKPVAERFNLVLGQCVDCPAGSTQSADGVSCEAA